MTEPVSSTQPPPVSSSSASPYFEDDGLRKVHPYNHTYLTYAKERWLGREILEIFTTEFRDRSKEFYNWAISNGTVMVNGQVVDTNYVLRNGDLISNVVHRHEPPIIAGQVSILHKNEETGVWVVEKKGSMPIHGTGRYRYNTLLEILKNDYGLAAVSTANRLDRLVSGIMLIATNKSAAKALGKDFQTPGRVGKEYVARVAGHFAPQMKFENEEEGLVCEEPILTIDKQIGVNVVHPEGRPCKTIFKRISYDPHSDTSVVRCRPVTGRSHQLRVHLQYLGHPIANDPIYNNAVAWGKGRAKGGMFNGLKPREEIAMRSAITALQEGSETPTTGTSSTSNLSTPWEEKDLDSSTAARKSLGSQLTEALRPDSPETHQARKKARHEAKQANQISNPNRRGKVDDVLGGGSETTLSSEAMEAILELRRVRDAEDNFARYRDMDRPPLPVALQIAEQAGNGGGKIDGRAHIGQGSISAKRGLRMMSKQEREKIASANYSTVTSVPSGNGQNEDKDDGEMDDPLGYVGKDEKGEYCKVCGIPLLPDPKPDMLLIWLHAIRYHTDEWDFSSPLPEWAREDWKVPASYLEQMKGGGEGKQGKMEETIE